MGTGPPRAGISPVEIDALSLLIGAGLCVGLQVLLASVDMLLLKLRIEGRYRLAERVTTLLWGAILLSTLLWVGYELMRLIS